MKANELMIGDWVMINPISYYQVEQIRMEFGELRIYLKGTEVFATKNEIMPIPITPEILEKNGFIKDTDEDDRVGNMYHLLVPTGYEINSYTIQVRLYKEPIHGISTLVKCWGWIPPHNVGLNDIHLCSANYVHQLQHAMRLCGIDKEIEL